MGKKFYDYLAKWGLEKYYAKLDAVGISTPETFSKLTERQLDLANIYDAKDRDSLRQHAQKVLKFRIAQGLATPLDVIAPEPKSDPIEILDTDGVFYKVNRIIERAQKFIVLISPYISLNDEQVTALKMASKRGVSIFIIYRDYDQNTPNPNRSLDDLQSIKNVQLSACPKLHAKIYANEDEIILSSRNLYTAQEGCSIEVGISISKELDLYEDLLERARRLFEISKRRKREKIDDIREDRSHKGFCIRCGKEIPYDLTKPFCRECYFSWATFNDYEFHENYCHKCGKKATVNDVISFARPLDVGCYILEKTK